MIRVSIVGASGYVGGELLRLLIGHPHAALQQVTSERLAGKAIHRAHPNLRKAVRRRAPHETIPLAQAAQRSDAQLRFCRSEDLSPCDVLFLCLPHGESSRRIDHFRKLAPRIVDLAADFRLRDPTAYLRWYGKPHPRPELLDRFVCGIPELYRAELRDADMVACAGCNATVSLLALRPLWEAGVVDGLGGDGDMGRAGGAGLGGGAGQAVIEVKVGSSEAGATISEGSHHPERAGAMRSYKPTGHRHTAEIVQGLGTAAEGPAPRVHSATRVHSTAPVHSVAQVHFSATAVGIVRGVLATCHVFTNERLDDKALWRLYRRAYGDEPFVRIVKERSGVHRYPDPKLLAGTNYCDIGFESDPESNRVVVLGAIDNLMKGAAGQAVHAFNVMHDFPERMGLEFQGLHPV